VASQAGIAASTAKIAHVETKVEVRGEIDCG
jgi:hypothetical protein